MAELQAIIDEIVTIQQGMSPPAGENTPVVYDEPPGTTMGYPCFLNIERAIDGEITYGPSFRIKPYLIDMHLLFMTFDTKYSYRSKRTWIKVVNDAFAAKLTLNASVTSALIVEEDYHPDGLTLPPGELAYNAITFTLRATMKEAVAFAT